MAYLGTWDASANQPPLINGTGTIGDSYYIAVTGTQNLGNGNISYQVAMSVQYNAAGIWMTTPLRYYEDLGSGTVTNFLSSGLPALFTTSVLNSTTTPVLSFLAIPQLSNLFYASPLTSGTPIWRSLAISDFNSGIGASGSSFWRGDGTWATPAGSGTVTSFSAGTLSPIFTTSVANPTTTPALSFNLSTATSYSFLANFTSGSAIPTYFQPTGTPSNLTFLRGDGSWATFISTIYTATVPLFITSGNVIYETQATSGTSGYVTSNDWLTFYSKLSNPMTIGGDLIYETSGTTVSRLPIGLPGQILSVSSTNLPIWQTTSGTSYTGSAGVKLTGNNFTIDESFSNTYLVNQTATKWITSGGTSSQFVKGDGSLDSLVYLTSGYTAGGDLTGIYPNPTIKSSVGLIGNPTATTQTSTDNSTKIATTAYVTTAIINAVAGVNPAVAVQAATTLASDTSSLTYNNGVSGIGATFTGAVNTPFIADGYTFTTLGQRALIKNDTQSPSGAFNGIFYVTQVQTSLLPPILTRALDYDQPSDINNTGAIPVINGTVNISTSWLLTSSVTTVGTDPLTYIKFSVNPTTILTTANLVAVAQGGTSLGTLTTNNLILGNGTSAPNFLAFSTSGNVVMSNGSAWISSAPNAPISYTGLIETVNFEDSTTGISAQTYCLDLSANYGYTISTLNILCTSGTCTAALQINGTNVTGLSAISVSSTLSATNASGANIVTSTNRVNLVISSPSGLNNLIANVKIVRT